MTDVPGGIIAHLVANANTPFHVSHENARLEVDRRHGEALDRQNEPYGGKQPHS